MIEAPVVSGCYPCDQQAAASLPPREAILRTEHWRVAHAFDSALPGWLVLLPTRHVTTFTELSEPAAGELGAVVRRMSAALETVTGCVKTYLMQFSEAEGFSHLHLHLVPRMADQPEEVHGPRIFAYLGADESSRVPAAEQDRLALALRAVASPA